MCYFGFDRNLYLMLTTQRSDIYSGASFISFILEVYLSVMMFSGSAVLLWLTEIRQVSNCKALLAFRNTHTDAHTGARTPLPAFRPFACIRGLPFPRLAHTHIDDRSACVCLCFVGSLFSWCTPQTSVLRSTWLITSCFLFPTLWLPALGGLQSLFKRKKIFFTSFI